MLSVSIITPTQNHGRFLRQAVDSVLSQKRDGLEYIVVDGASTDDSCSILQGYGNRLQWISEPDCGPADAFNKGLMATSNDIIGWLNADDIYAPNAIDTACQFLSERPDIDVAYGHIQQIDAHSEVLQTVKAQPWSRDRMQWECLLRTPAVFFRRRVVDQCGMLDEHLNYWADYDYWIRLADRGIRFAQMPALLGMQRMHADGRRNGTQCRRHQAASIEEMNDILADNSVNLSSRRILRYAHAKAVSDGHSRTSDSGFDQAVMKHAIDGLRRWNQREEKPLSFARSVLGLAFRHAGKEIDSLVRHPNCATRFLPQRVRQFAQAHLHRKLFKLKIHPPRPIALPKHYGGESASTDGPSISVVTPNLNQGHYLEATIQSVLGQEYPKLQYIVQDGGSEDCSLDVIRRYEHKLARWDSSPDRGQAHAINRGMRHTTGEIMAFLNSDDLLLPGSLAYVASYFDKHADVDVIYGHRLLVNEQGAEIGRWVLPSHDDRVLPWADYIPQETMFWRRRAWEKVGSCLDETFQFALDWDLILRFQAESLRFVRLPRFLGAFRVTEETKTSRLVETVGLREMARLRKRVLGREPSRREIRRVMRPYLWRHFVCETLYSLGVAKY